MSRNQPMDNLMQDIELQISAVEQKIINADITREELALYNQYLDPNLNLFTMIKYELDKAAYSFDKICLLKIENSDMLMGHIGQVGYYALIESVLMYFNEWKKLEPDADSLKTYSTSANTFILADSEGLSEASFYKLIEQIQKFFTVSQKNLFAKPVLIRFIVVSGGDFLLERAYRLLEFHRNSQAQIITESEPTLSDAVLGEQLETISLIQTAISEDQVIPYYQGIYNNQTKRIDKFEALMRIYDKEGNLLSPKSFMEVAKRYKLYLDFNLKMFQTVLRDFEGLDYEVSINISAHDIASPRFLHEMEEGLKNFHKPSNLIFEILEDEYFTDLQLLKDFIELVRKYGVKIAVDDFGTGYSNLLEIIKIKPDYLKIDGQIIQDINKNSESAVIVNAIVSLAKRLDIELVAEYVENQETQTAVELLEIHYSQGFFFSKPKPFEHILYDVNKSTSI